MTDKQTFDNGKLKVESEKLIIDGVDITNCIHRATNKLCGDIDPYCRCYTGSCKDIFNCYYKQLKRKEQECERLKEAIKTKTGKDYINEIQDITMKYECHQKSMGVCWWGKYGKETKCIGIKECHKRELKAIQKLEIELDQLKAENKTQKETIDGFLTILDKLGKSNIKLRETLTEIKEIARVNSINTCWTVLNICDECEEQNKCEDQSPFTKLKQILQKISECEVKDANI